MFQRRFLSDLVLRVKLDRIGRLLDVRFTLGSDGTADIPDWQLRAINGCRSSARVI
jgi:hypothetical protein